MLIEVIKIQLINLLSSFSNRNSKKRKGSKFMIFVPALAFLYLSFFYSFSLLDAFKGGNEYLLIYIMLLATMVFIVTLAIQQAQGYLFGFKDYDFLMSLPISTKVVMISKLASFVIMMFIYAILLFLPTIFIYGINTNQSILYYVIALIGFLNIPCLPIVLASLIGMLIKKIAGKSKYKNLLNNIMMVVIFLVIFFGSQFLTQGSINSDISMFDGLVTTIKNFLPSIYYYAYAMVNNDFVSLLISLVINFGIFIIFIYIFTKSFISINQDNNEGFHVKNYRLTTLKSDNIQVTLFKKEFRRFIGNFIYVFNMAFGQLFLIGGSIYLLINKDLIEVLFASDFAMFKDQVFVLIILALLAVGFMSNTAGVSISLEGKQLWITKTLPIKTIDILMSKVFVNVSVITVPGIISILILAFALGLNFVELIIAILFAIEIGFTVGMFGIIVNLYLPKLDFDRDIIVVKQSASSFVSIFSGLLIAIGVIFLYVGVLSSTMSGFSFVTILVVVLMILCILMYLYIKKIGVKKFDNLAN